MAYDPFGRGGWPVGVRSGQVIDVQRGNRALPFEVWYPSAARYIGLDLDPATQDVFTVGPGTPPLRQSALRDAAVAPGSCPLVLFSHTSGGHRKQSSFLCTHLASHGYVVPAVDHVGNAAIDFARRGLARCCRQKSARPTSSASSPTACPTAPVGRGAHRRRG